MRTRLTEISLKRPWAVIIVTLIITLAFATQFPRMKTDTDPNNMLPETADVRVSNLEVEQIFGLHKDMMAVGVVNDSGIFNPETVNRMARLTEEIRGSRLPWQGF